jgi:heme exporter protein B
MSAIRAVFLRDVKLDLKRGGQAVFLPAFFLLIVMLFPLGLGPEADVLSSAAPGLLMVAALLASVLPLEKLYTDDMQDGTADLVRLSGQPLPLYVAGKALAHWCVAGLPLVIVAPLLALMTGLKVSAFAMLAVFIPATVLFILIGQLGALLSLNAQRSSVLLALLVIPLYIPVLIFGAGAMALMQATTSAAGPLLFLWAMLAFAAPVVPLLGAQLLKMQMNA